MAPAIVDATQIPPVVVGAAAGPNPTRGAPGAPVAPDHKKSDVHVGVPIDALLEEDPAETERQREQAKRNKAMRQLLLETREIRGLKRATSINPIVASATSTKTSIGVVDTSSTKTSDTNTNSSNQSSCVQQPPDSLLGRTGRGSGGGGGSTIMGPLSCSVLQQESTTSTFSSIQKQPLCGSSMQTHAATPGVSTRIEPIRKNSKELNNSKKKPRRSRSCGSSPTTDGQRLRTKEKETMTVPARRLINTIRSRRASCLSTTTSVATTTTKEGLLIPKLGGGEHQNSKNLLKVADGRSKELLVEVEGDRSCKKQASSSNLLGPKSLSTISTTDSTTTAAGRSGSNGVASADTIATTTATDTTTVSTATGSRTKGPKTGGGAKGIEIPKTKKKKKKGPADAGGAPTATPITTDLVVEEKNAKKQRSQAGAAVVSSDSIDNKEINVNKSVVKNKENKDNDSAKSTTTITPSSASGGAAAYGKNMPGGGVSAHNNITDKGKVGSSMMTTGTSAKGAQTGRENRSEKKGSKGKAGSFSVAGKNNNSSSSSSVGGAGKSNQQHHYNYPTTSATGNSSSWNNNGYFSSHGPNHDASGSYLDENSKGGGKNHHYNNYAHTYYSNNNNKGDANTRQQVLNFSSHSAHAKGCNNNNSVGHLSSSSGGFGSNLSGSSSPPVMWTTGPQAGSGHYYGGTDNANAAVGSGLINKGGRKGTAGPFGGPQGSTTTKGAPSPQYHNKGLHNKKGFDKSSAQTPLDNSQNSAQLSWRRQLNAQSGADPSYHVDPPSSSSSGAAAAPHCVSMFTGRPSAGRHNNSAHGQQGWQFGGSTPVLQNHNVLNCSQQFGNPGLNTNFVNAATTNNGNNNGSVGPGNVPMMNVQMNAQNGGAAAQQEEAAAVAYYVNGQHRCCLEGPQQQRPPSMMVNHPQSRMMIPLHSSSSSWANLVTSCCPTNSNNCDFNNVLNNNSQSILTQAQNLLNAAAVVTVQPVAAGPLNMVPGGAIPGGAPTTSGGDIVHTNSAAANNIGTQTDATQTGANSSPQKGAEKEESHGIAAGPTLQEKHDDTDLKRGTIGETRSTIGATRSVAAQIAQELGATSPTPGSPVVGEPEKSSIASNCSKPPTTSQLNISSPDNSCASDSHTSWRPVPLDAVPFANMLPANALVFMAPPGNNYGQLFGNNYDQQYQQSVLDTISRRVGVFFFDLCHSYCIDTIYL